MKMLRGGAAAAPPPEKEELKEEKKESMEEDVMNVKCMMGCTSTYSRMLGEVERKLEKTLTKFI